jgi:hypothetical protein
METEDSTTFPVFKLDHYRRDPTIDFSAAGRYISHGFFKAHTRQRNLLNLPSIALHGHGGQRPWLSVFNFDREAAQ